MVLASSLRRLGTDPRLVKLARLVGLFLTVASVVLIVWQGVTQTVWGSWENLATGLLVSFSAYGMSFGLQGIAWCLLISGLSQARVGWRDLEIYAYSNMMRRTPGAIWYLIERVERYRDGGLSARMTLAASAAEWLLLILAAFIVYVSASSSWFVASLRAAEIALFPLLVLLGIMVLKWRSQWRERALKEAPRVSRVTQVATSLPEILVVLLVYSACYVVGGATIYVLVYIVHPTTQLLFLDAVSLWALIGGIGFVSSVVIPINMGAT